MNALGWLILGLLVGWAVEFAIDFFYWRKKARLEAEALVQQEALLLAQQTELGHKQSALRLREKEVADLQASVATRDAELLQAAQRMEERSDDLGRLEQQTEKRRADLDRMNMTLSEREKDIASRQDQLRSKEADYGRRLNALEATEQELARRVAVVANREDAMQSWEGRILSREHDVTDREASVNHHAARIAADAAAFDATKHLLKQRHRTPEGRDNLQALVGIDQKVAGLLHDAGIRSFERLAETSLGELTRILEGAGPRFALANPLSWAEQAAHWLNEDYVALDRLQCELLGIERESVGEQLFARMTAPAAAATGAVPAAESASGAAPSAEASPAAEAEPSTAAEPAAEATASGEESPAAGQPAAEPADPRTGDEPSSGPLTAAAGEAAPFPTDEANPAGSVTQDGEPESTAAVPSAGGGEPAGIEAAGATDGATASADRDMGGQGERPPASASDATEAGQAHVDSTVSSFVAEADSPALAQEDLDDVVAGAADGAGDGEADIVQAASASADDLLSLVAAEEVDVPDGGVWQDRAKAVADAEDVELTSSAASRGEHGH